jgi:hypothetical protein
MYDILHPCGDKLIADSDAARYTKTTDRIEKIARRTGSTLDMVRERDVVGSFRPFAGAFNVSAVSQHFIELHQQH